MVDATTVPKPLDRDCGTSLQESPWNFQLALLRPNVVLLYLWWDIPLLLNDYKVVAFFGPWKSRSGTGSGMPIAIYSLRENRWRIKRKKFIVPEWKEPPYPYPYSSFFQVVFVERIAYWFNSKNYGKQRTHLISFDFDVEEINVLELPDIVGEEIKARFIFNLGDEDSLGIFSVSTKSKRIWIHEETRDNNSKAAPWRLCFSRDTNVEFCKFIKRTKMSLPDKIVQLHNTNTFLMCLQSRRALIYNISDHTNVQFTPGIPIDLAPYHVEVP